MRVSDYNESVPHANSLFGQTEYQRAEITDIADFMDNQQGSVLNKKTGKKGDLNVVDFLWTIL